MGKKLWKSLEDYQDDPALAEVRQSEFPADVNEAVADLREGLNEGPAVNPTEPSQPTADDLRAHLPAVSRRGFLKLSGAAAVFGLAGCWHEPPETLVPHRQQPEGTIIGKPVRFSSMIRVDGRPVSVLVKTKDFRPIKLEGNPEHPTVAGRLSLRGQAALLDCYDPDRLRRGPKQRSEGTAADKRNEAAGFVNTGWAELDQAAAAALGAGAVGLIVPSIDGMANQALLAGFDQAVGDLRIAAYQAFAQDSLVEARRLAFGAEYAVEPLYDFAAAKTLVCFGGDPLGGGLATVQDHRGIAHNRKAPTLGEVFVFEPGLSQIGAKADLRMPVLMSQMADAAWAVAAAVAEQLGVAFPEAAKAAAARGAADGVVPTPAALAQARDDAEQQTAIAHVAASLVARKQAGEASLIYTGGATTAGSESLGLHLAACYLNSILGNEGVTISGARAPQTRVQPSVAATRAVLESAAAGELATLIIWGVNPAFDLPGAERLLTAARERGVTIIALSDRVDETASFADWVAPVSHDLEAWGDGESEAGTFEVQQPTIRPLWNNRSAQQSLMTFAAKAGYAAWQVAASEPITGSATPRAVAGRDALYQPAADGVMSWHGAVQQVWQSAVRQATSSLAAPAAFWKAALAAGFVATGSRSQAAPSFSGRGLEATTAQTVAGSFELSLAASRALGDGSQANNAWLQEVPDPITKVCWDTWLSMSIADAKQLGLGTGLGSHPVVTLTVNAIGNTTQDVSVPVVIQPGQRNGTLELYLGFGRSKAGTVADGGGVDGQQVNGYQLTGDDRRWGIGASVAKASTSYRLASTQNHHFMDGRYTIAKDDVLANHKKDPEGKKRGHHHALWEGGTNAINERIANHDRVVQGAAQVPTGQAGNLSMWDRTHVYPGRRWGMLIDTGACNGCGACIVACSAENNVPVVGREEVRRGREMHWMRIDRYYTALTDEYLGTGESDAVEKGDGTLEVEVIQQPMLCQQCGHAPCEEVCPANATMHNDEGQNVQVYNRCIGTRFCANNCPYKVRKFNWYEYSKYRAGPKTDDPFLRVVRNVFTEGRTSSQSELATLPLNLMLNPDVTVRSKGVMEKCNFCISRTRDIRESEKRTNRAYDDTDPLMTSACAQTCPSEAIVFGDIQDPFSQVNQVATDNRHQYQVLNKELNTRPSIVYLRNVRNRPVAAFDDSVGEGHH